jgi:TctA family transporter
MTDSVKEEAFFERRMGGIISGSEVGVLGVLRCWGAGMRSKRVELPRVTLGAVVLIVLAGACGAVLLSRTLKPQQRVLFWIVLVLAGLYLLPQFYRGFKAGSRVGAELREQQNR